MGCHRVCCKDKCLVSAVQVDQADQADQVVPNALKVLVTDCRLLRVSHLEQEEIETFLPVFHTLKSKFHPPPMNYTQEFPLSLFYRINHRCVLGHCGI